uniref:Uncharacterized protein LOC108037598 n=1 Tax=Drosophila rhopaloa TaxID=1041015 RepID=A0A6P4DWA6_DRORH
MASVAECNYSVFDQVTHLATLLASEEQAPNRPTAALVARRRSKIYEGLLRSGPMSSEDKLEMLSQVSSEVAKNPKRRDSLHSFRNLLAEQDSADSHETEKDTENHPETGKSVHRVLAGQHTDSPHEMEANAENHCEPGIRLLKPGVLKLHETPDRLPRELVYPKTLKSLTQMQRALKPLQLQPYSDIFLTNMKAPLPEMPLLRINPSQCNYSGLAESMTRMKESSEQPMQPPPRLPVLEKKSPPAPEEPPFVAQDGPQKYFVSEQMMTNELRLYQNKELVLFYIGEAALIDHLKKAAAGLQSETFLSSSDDQLVLVLRPNTTLRTVLPEILEDFSDPFLRAGSAFRRLSARAKWNRNTMARLERPLNRAMREILVDFLANNREFLLSQSANNLSQLLINCRPALQLLHQLEKMFQNEPKLNLDSGVSGPFLLSCISLAIDTCGNSDFLQLLIYLLRCISQTYFVQLQRWIYQGELDEAVNEIFISRTPNTSPPLMNECSKEFFDRGYQVVNEAIPEFLSGCELDVLQCGKYNQVLKAYDAQHAVFDVKYPDIVVCLTEQQLKEMRRNLVDEYAVIYQRFGWCSMQSIFEERMAAKRSFANLMMKRTQAHLIAWEAEQRELLLKANAQKKIIYDQISAEQELHQQSRLEKRRQEIINELAFLRESERVEDKRLEREKHELQKQVSQLAAELIEKEQIESKAVTSPDQSTNSDLSFASCIEGPDSRPDSASDQDDEKTQKAANELEKPSAIESDRSKEVESQKPSELVLENCAVIESEQPVESQLLFPNVVQFQRSHSDEINCNQQVPSQTEYDRNRQHVLSSDQFQECHTRIHISKSDSAETNTSSGLHAQLPPDVNANLNRPETEELSELQRNRLRNEHHDVFSNFNCTEDEHIQRLRCRMDANTELARNRRRVLGCEFGITLGDKDLEENALPCSQMEANTERAMNRRRVMESEFGITLREEKALPLLPLELNKLHVEVPLAVLTPMSTTSDVDIFGLSPKEIVDNDAANNNNLSQSSEGSFLEPAEPEPVLVKPTKTFSEFFKPNFHLPTYFGMERNVETEKDTQKAVITVPEAYNPFMTRRCLQLSVMAPVNAHYALLRNEVLRIFQELRIYEHFRKLRNYFFLLDGQFGTLLTSDILGRIKAGIDPRSLCQKGILDTMLTHALAGCSADETTVSQNLTLQCTNIPDTLNFMSVEATSMLTLHCQVDWPLNLVISSETVAKYGQIFGYLLKLRHVSFVLEGSYEYLQQLGKLLGPELRTCAHFRHLQMVRHKFSHFMTSFQTHLVAKALQATWKSFKEELCTVDSIEGLYKQHAAYLKRVAFLALLNRRSAKVKETIDNILVITLRFCKVIQSQSFMMDQENKFVHPRFKRLLQEEAEFEKFMQYLIYLGKKAATSGYQEEIGDLICIINFNNYYKVAEDNSST